jgi:hypothetical protein
MQIDPYKSCLSGGQTGLSGGQTGLSGARRAGRAWTLFKIKDERLKIKIADGRQFIGNS